MLKQKMIFLGTLFRKEDETSITKKTKIGRPQNQANIFQWNIIDGLLENRESLSIINCLPVGTFPNHYSDIVLKGKEWRYRETYNRELGSINLPFLKQIIRSIKTRVIIENGADRNIVIYSTYLPYLWAIRKLDRSFTIVLIVTDIPEFYDYSLKTSRIKKCLRRYYNKCIYKCLDRIDGFVLLTEQMREAIGVGERPYVIVEGVCSRINEDILRKSEQGEEKRIVYTGSLNKCFGINTLVRAFQLIDNNKYRLVICGSGDYEDEIKEAAKVDERIEFLGIISRNNALRLQRQAAVLVNPRNNDNDFTKHSFPSKTMEYLQSQVPTVAYKLDGIPDEYDEYINYIGNNSLEALRDIIVSICEDEKGIYKERARRAKEFVETEKNNITQTKKIQELFQRLHTN